MSCLETETAPSLWMETETRPKAKDTEDIEKTEDIKKDICSTYSRD